MTTRFKRTGRVAVCPSGVSTGKHQNKYAFRHNPNSSKTKMIESIPNFGLCSKCHDIIEWRKQYRKYKPLKDAKRCQHCREKKVVFAYHVICQDCSRQKSACPKCIECRNLTPKTSDGGFEDFDPQLLKGMKERDRRALRRMMDNGEITLDELLSKYTENDDEDDDDDEAEAVDQIQAEDESADQSGEEEAEVEVVEEELSDATGR